MTMSMFMSDELFLTSVCTHAGDISTLADPSVVEELIANKEHAK